MALLLIADRTSDYSSDVITNDLCLIAYHKCVQKLMLESKQIALSELLTQQDCQGDFHQLRNSNFIFFFIIFKHTIKFPRLVLFKMSTILSFAWVMKVISDTEQHFTHCLVLISFKEMADTALAFCFLYSTCIFKCYSASQRSQKEWRHPNL